MIYNVTTFNRPVLIFGAGVQGCRDDAVAFAEKLGWPVALTWGAIDLLPYDHPLNVGGFGTHALRAPNFVVQNADFLLTIGTRLDTKATGTPAESFARAAQIWMVDIDSNEINKLGSKVKGLHMEASRFMASATFETAPVAAWWAQVRRWQARWPIDQSIPYQAVLRLSEAFGEGDIIVSDTGHALAWMMQAFRFKKGQRFIHAFNNTPMGYGLPAAIGAAFANPGKQIRLICGDGGLQLNIQEWAVVAHHNLPITTYLFNNRSHGMCAQTQRQWLDGKFYSTTQEGGLAVPDFQAIAKAYGISLVEFEIPLGSQLEPCVLAGRPNEDASPLLSRQELQENMLIPIWKS